MGNSNCRRNSLERRPSGVLDPQTTIIQRPTRERSVPYRFENYEVTYEYIPRRDKVRFKSTSNLQNPNQPNISLLPKTFTEQIHLEEQEGSYVEYKPREIYDFKEQIRRKLGCDYDFSRIDSEIDCFYRGCCNTFPCTAHAPKFPTAHQDPPINLKSHKIFPQSPHFALQNQAEIPTNLKPHSPKRNLSKRQLEEGKQPAALVEGNFRQVEKSYGIDKWGRRGMKMMNQEYTGRKSGGIDKRTQTPERDDLHWRYPSGRVLERNDNFMFESPEIKQGGEGRDGKIEGLSLNLANRTTQDRTSIFKTPATAPIDQYQSPRFSSQNPINSFDHPTNIFLKSPANAPDLSKQPKMGYKEVQALNFDYISEAPQETDQEPYNTQNESIMRKNNILEDNNDALRASKITENVDYHEFPPTLRNQRDSDNSSLKEHWL